MPAAFAATLAVRLGPVIDLLCRAVAARLDRPGRPGLAGPLIVLIWARLRAILTRVAALAGRLAAGRHRRVIARRRPRPAPRRPAQRRVPHAPAWLLRLVPEAAVAAAQLRQLFADPDFAALLAAAPQMRRLLRPLGHMLGVRLPPPPASVSPEPTPAPPVTQPPAALPAPVLAQSPAPSPRRTRRRFPIPRPPPPWPA